MRATLSRPADLGDTRAAVRAYDDLRVEDRDQRVEVALPRGGEVGVDDGALASEVGLRWRRCAADAAARTARELPGRLGRALDESGDLIEGDLEHVVEHEGESLRRAQGVEDDLQRDPDRVGQEGLVFRIAARIRGDDRLGHERVERLLRVRAAVSQYVQADPRDHGGQPAVEVLDLVRVHPPEAKPRLLDRIVGVAQRIRRSCTRPSAAAGARRRRCSPARVGPCHTAT